MKFIYRSKQKLFIFVMGFIALIESLIYLLSFGFFTTDIRAWFLFDFLYKGNKISKYLNKR